MKKVSSILLFLFIACGLSSCAVAGGIFKGGMIVGVLIVVAVIGLILFLISRGSGKS